MLQREAGLVPRGVVGHPQRSEAGQLPDAAASKAVAAETVEKTSSKWWWIPVGIGAAALLAGLMRLLTRRKAEPVKVKRDS